MNGRPPSDLIRQMRLRIAEEAYLWELTQQVTDYYGAGRRIVHGPWQAADCQQVLARWFDCGLIDCVAVSWSTKVRSEEVVHHQYDADWRTRATEDGQYLILSREDAGALLSDPSTWRPEGRGAGVMLCESDQADGLSFDAWFGKLAGLADHLIYEDPLDRVSEGKAEKVLAEPGEFLIAGLWVRAFEHAGAGLWPIMCPANRDAYLAFDWHPTNSETVTGESIDDTFYFVDRGKVGREQPFPFGRHRLWCPGCGAEKYLVVTRRPT